MPSSSVSQQQAAGIAHAAKKGEIPKSKLRGPSKQMFKKMNGLKIKKFAHTKRKGLPKRVPECLTARQMFERERLTESRAGGWGGHGDWHGGRSDKFTPGEWRPRKLSVDDAKHRREADATDKRHNDWAKEHGVKCTCGAPTGSNHSSACAVFKGYHAQNEGRDDAPKLGLGKTGLKFARMTSKEAFNTTDGTDAKWKTSLKLRSELGGESPSAKMKSKDAVGKVPHAMKGLGDSITPQQVVDKLLAD